MSQVLCSASAFPQGQDPQFFYSNCGNSYIVAGVCSDSLIIHRIEYRVDFLTVAHQNRMRTLTRGHVRQSTGQSPITGGFKSKTYISNDIFHGAGISEALFTLSAQNSRSRSHEDRELSSASPFRSHPRFCDYARSGRTDEES